MADFLRLKVTTCVVLVLYLQACHASEIVKRENERLEAEIGDDNVAQKVISRVRRGDIPDDGRGMPPQQLNGAPDGAGDFRVGRGGAAGIPMDARAMPRQGVGAGGGAGLYRQPGPGQGMAPAPGGDMRLRNQLRPILGQGPGGDLRGDAGRWPPGAGKAAFPALPDQPAVPAGQGQGAGGVGAGRVLPQAQAGGAGRGAAIQNQQNMPPQLPPQNANLQQQNAFGQVNRQPVAPRKVAKMPMKPIRIAESPECISDVQRHCAKKTNNFAVLDCLQQVTSEDGVSADCNHFLWTYKMNLTKDYRFDNAAAEVCREDMRKLPDCSGKEPGQGLVLPCLMDHMENLTGQQCIQYLNRMKEITFSDYRLINGFYDLCHSDITKFHCGIVNQNDPNQAPVPHSQGGTIHCLEKHVRELEKNCRLQILRVAELSSNDYHQDRRVYYACRDDRERFCRDVMSGKGRIYKCLKEHKLDPAMSTDCKDSLTTRQQVAAQDVKVNFNLFHKCKKEIQVAQCSLGVSNTRQMKMATVLMCLEQAEREKSLTISGDCKGELLDVRKQIMSDYMISPELMTGCRSEIENDCTGLRREGKTIHCLMGLGKRNKLSEECKKALSDLVQEADAGSNYKLDPVLSKACQDVKAKLCEKKTDAEALSCLMENMDADEMNEECANRLLEIQYFISRNFRLDPILYKNCEDDARRFCYEEAFGRNKEVPSGLVFACLHTHLHDAESALQPKCVDQMHRALRQRAVSVHLNPRIEQECRQDLGEFCPDKTKRGEELRCLQENFDDLRDSCRLAVGNFTVEEAEDIRMNRKIISACAPMLKRFCLNQLKGKKLDEGDVLRCLVEHKNDDDMETKCQASIEHFQLIQMKDFRFSFKFKESCRKNVLTFCRGSRDKASIVQCLSNKVRESVMRGEESPLDPECRAQLKFELLQRDENIELDPDLKRVCSFDIDQLCAKVTKGNAATLECLRSHQEDLSNGCHVKVFNREKEMAAKPDIDYALMHGCKKTIKLKCKEVAPEMLIECLKSHKDDPDTEQRCKVVLAKRQIERNSNIHLNPLLMKACKLDMKKFCKDLEGVDEENMEGKFIECLRKKFQEKGQTLTKTCSSHISGLIREGAGDYRLDRSLVKYCMEFIQKNCADELENPGTGRVEECVKTKIKDIRDPKCQQQVIGLFREGLADIHVDPLLYKACALDIKHYCGRIPQGQGQQMSCLLEVLDDKTVALQPDCRRMLSERKEMWEYAAQVAPVMGMLDVYMQLANSPSHNYFLLVFVSFVGVLFFFGLCCGRATKRVRHDIKSR